MADHQVQHESSVPTSPASLPTQNTASTSEVPAQTASTSQAPGPTTFLDNVRRDFSRSFPSLGGGGRRIPLNNPRPSKIPKVTAYFKPRNSWTHDFCLFANNTQNVTPSLNHLSKLKDAGLGKKRIVFPDKKAPFMKLKSVLETEYPKLQSQDGAFELMRAEGGGNSRPVCLIPMPAGGYSVPYLKEAVSGTTMIYIRPIKGSLSLEKAEVSTSANTPLTECANCQKQVPILNLRQHYEECKPMTVDVNEKTSILNDDVEVLVDSEVPNEDKVPDKNTACNHSDVDTLLNWQSQLRSAFPDAKDDDIEEITSRSLTVDEAAGFLLDKTSTSPEDTTLLDVEDLIEMFVDKNALPSEEAIVVDRESLWIDILKFYKKSHGKPDTLRRELCVSFCNEEGLDGGALKVEFFTLALKEVKNRLFEGMDSNMVPIKDATKGMLFHIAGLIVSHAVCQKGSNGFPILAPHLYSYIVNEPEDQIASHMKKEYIPLDASTALLHDLLKGLESCQMNDDLHALLEENEKSEGFWQVINSSRWPKEKVIDINSRDFLFQHLVYHELLTSRRNEMDEFKEGLKSLGFLEFLCKNKEKCKVLLCSLELAPLNIETLKDMMLNVDPRNFAERQSYELFLEYIGQEEDAEFPGDSRLRSLLQFWTGWTDIPFGGLTKRLKVSFLADDDANRLPTASACTAVLRIPTVHSSKKTFFEAMDIALKFAKVGFANP